MQTRPFGNTALAVLLALGLALPAFAAAQTTTDIGTIDKSAAEKVFPTKPSYSPYAARTFPTRPFFGDTHLHTSFSMDAGAFGARSISSSSRITRTTWAFSPTSSPASPRYSPSRWAASDRNVIFRDNGDKASQVDPFTVYPPYGSTNPIELWKWMDDYEKKPSAACSPSHTTAT